MAELFALNPKTSALTLLESGSIGSLCRSIPSRPIKDSKGEPIKYSVYTDTGRLVSSTYSGGANPHDWKVMAGGVRRRHSGLVRGESHRQREEKAGTYKAKVAKVV